MWFKNIQVYRFTKPLELSAEEIASQLEQQEFKPCDSQQPLSRGWTPPLGRHGSDFVHVANGYIMICSKTQEKLLPAAVINEELEEKVLEIEESQSRKVSRKERTSLKEEITFSLLPRAFLRSRLEFAYISLDEGLLVLKSSSEKKADEFVSSLRTALGSLPVIPLECRLDPVDVMTQWVKEGKPPGSFELGEECEFRSENDVSRVIKCKNQDLQADEILNHLKIGMEVTKLAVSWNERLEFMLDEKLMIKRIRFTDVFQDEVRENENSADDQATQFDVDFSIMTLEYAGFFKALIGALGDLKPLENLQAASGSASGDAKMDDVTAPFETENSDVESADAEPA